MPFLNHTFYEAELRPLRQELAFHVLVRRVLDGFTAEDYDALLSLLNRPALAVLGRYYWDELLRAYWLQLLSLPRWLLLGARALVWGSGSRRLRFHSPEAWQDEPVAI